MAYQRGVVRGKEKRLMGLVGLVGLECILGGIVFWELPNQLMCTATQTTANPFFFALRLGCVMVLLFGCWQYARKWPGRAIHVREISRESLLVYVLHLLIIYRLAPNNQSLSSVYRDSLTFCRSMAVLTALVFLMWLAAGAWSFAKQKSQRNSRRAAYSMAALAVLLFFSN